MLQHTHTVVTKASGEQEPFQADKLRNSLERAGASPAIISQILEDTLQNLRPGISTKKIYRHAFELMRKSSKPSAARYKLKQAIMELGPSGFPFERLVGELLAYQGYAVQVGQQVQGRCVQHEVDVVAERDGEHILVECKYHNQAGRISDVKIPLYIKARFDDIRERWEQAHVPEAKFHSGWIFTNTRFSGDAIQYAGCAGLKLVSWDYPADDNLRSLIDRSRLYPLTSLTSISKTAKQHLLEKGLILCRDIISAPELLQGAGVHQRQHKAVLEEAALLCS